MTERTKKLLDQTRWLAALFAAGVTLLSLQSIFWKNLRIFQYAAFALAIIGLFFISFIVSRIIQDEKE